MNDHPPEADRRERRMKIRRAISAYAQSEKVKSGLIWINQVADQTAAMEAPKRSAATALLQTLAHLVAGEADLAAKFTRDERWHEVGKKINLALVMIRSGVPQETGFHLTQALSLVTRIGSQAAMSLRERDLF
jgi:hypothetical protein